MSRKFVPACFGQGMFGYSKFGNYADSQPDKAHFEEARFGYARFGVYSPMFDNLKRKLEKTK